MDRTEQIISQRLGELKRKTDFMHEMQQREVRRRAFRRRLIWGGSAAAACLAIVLALMPLLRQGSISGLDVSMPDFENYRGTGVTVRQIERTINAGDYEKALEMTEQALKNSEKELAQVDDDAEDETEAEYLYTLEMDFNAELQWTRIYLLVKLNRKAEAEAALDHYLTLGDFANHYPEASRLRAELRH